MTKNQFIEVPPLSLTKLGYVLVIADTCNYLLKQETQEEIRWWPWLQTTGQRSWRTKYLGLLVLTFTLQG